MQVVGRARCLVSALVVTQFNGNSVETVVTRQPDWPKANFYRSLGHRPGCSTHLNVCRRSPSRMPKSRRDGAMSAQGATLGSDIQQRDGSPNGADLTAVPRDAPMGLVARNLPALPGLAPWADIGTSLRDCGESVWIMLARTKCVEQRGHRPRKLRPSAGLAEGHIQIIPASRDDGLRPMRLLNGCAVSG